jgi:hypothetical protein
MPEHLQPGQLRVGFPPGVRRESGPLQLATNAALADLAVRALAELAFLRRRLPTRPTAAAAAAAHRRHARTRAAIVSAPQLHLPAVEMERSGHLHRGESAGGNAPTHLPLH